MYDKNRIDEIMAVLRRLLIGPGVIEISSHFAIYFDELGITVELSPDATDQELLALKEKAEAYLLPEKSHREEPFKWMLTFNRRGKDTNILFPDGMFVSERKRK